MLFIFTVMLCVLNVGLMQKVHVLSHAINLKPAMVLVMGSFVAPSNRKGICLSTITGIE